MTRHSNQEASGVEEARDSSSSCKGCEECVEGEPGGKQKHGAEEDAMEILSLASLFGGILSSEGTQN